MAAEEHSDEVRFCPWAVGLKLVWAGILLFATSTLLAVQRQEPWQKRLTLRVEPTGDLNGEVAVYDGNGRVTKLFVGLGEPAVLLTSGNNNFYVADREAGRILEVSPKGKTIWACDNPEMLRSIVAMTTLPNGNLLLACGWQGVIEMKRDGAVVWRVPSPLQNADVTGAVRLPDGATVVTLRLRHHSLYWVPPGFTHALEVMTTLPEELPTFTRCAPYATRSGEFLLWDNASPGVYRCTLRNGDLVVKEALPVRGAWFAFSGDDGDLYYTHEDPRFCHWSRTQEETCWQTTFRPLAVIPTGDRRGYLVSYKRIADASWPESWPPPPAEPTIHWSRFWLWVGVAAVLAGVLWLGPWPRGRASGPKQRGAGKRNSFERDSAQGRLLAAEAGRVRRV